MEKSKSGLWIFLLRELVERSLPLGKLDYPGLGESHSQQIDVMNRGRKGVGKLWAVCRM